MARFLGMFTPRLDDKGRLVLPAKFRDAFAEGLVITRGQEHCLNVWTMAGFDAEAERVMRGSSDSAAHRGYTRVFGSGASEEVPDKQGRLTIPPHQRRWAGLDKEIAVIGAVNHVEVWDLAAWEAYEAQHEEPFAGIDDGTPIGRAAGA